MTLRRLLSLKLFRSIQMLAPRRSISENMKSMSSCFVEGFEKTTRQKFGNSLSGWYEIIRVPSRIIRDLSSGATAFTRSFHSVDSRSSADALLSARGTYMKHTLTYCGCVHQKKQKMLNSKYLEIERSYRIKLQTERNSESAHKYDSYLHTSHRSSNPSVWRQRSVKRSASSNMRSTCSANPASPYTNTFIFY